MISFYRDDVEVIPMKVKLLDSYEDAYYTIFPAFVPADMSADECHAVVHEAIPGDRCEHSYDCCGNFYGSHGHVMGESFLNEDTKIVWVRRYYSRNV